MPRRPERRTGPELRDHVDTLIDGWATERPDLDTAAVGVVYRLVRIAAVWNAEIERLFAGFGVTTTDFAVLANLRRAGEPFQLHQRHLMTALRLTSGTVSLRIDKMVERDLVTRGVDPLDARATVVTLTEEGAALFDRIAPLHLANENRLLAALPDDQRSQLAELLRTVLVDIEQPHDGRPDHRLGFVATPSPVAQRKRADLGLAPQHGLLVESVDGSGAAARAGLRPGDTLTELGGVHLYSLTCLERALASGGGPFVATVLRAGKSVALSIDDA